MFIKNIIISGFRSYREQSFPDGLSPKTNAIIGKNGSGKSNFFAAVQFVLNQRSTNLRPAERKELFHVGSGRPSLSIFVEIVFDNSDGRLVIPGRAEEAEVRIRRTVGLKQDEFRVNDRKFSADEVHQLLESAGFSASNPYYIVEQGKITHLANMSEEDRYQIIKDVAGTKVYESRRSESERILAETQTKQAQIDQSISQLEAKLKELEGETAELKEFMETDREKKCIEYCIFHSEMESAKESLLKLETEWNTNKAVIHENQDSESSSEQAIQQIEGHIADVTLRIGRLEIEKNTIEKEIAALNNQQAVAELDANDAARKVSRIEQEHHTLTKERAELEKSVSKATGEANEKRKILEKNSIAAKKSLAQVEENQSIVERLQEKRNRTKLFKNRKDRDTWISNEIKINQDAVNKLQTEKDSLQKEIMAIDNRIKEDSKEAKSTAGSTEKVEKDLSSRETAIAAALNKRGQLNQSHRELWQVVHEQENKVQRIDDNLQSTKHHLERTIRRDIRQGLQSLNEILQGMKPELRKSVHGPLIELITVQEGYSTAVEITAGNTLFNVVVDTFDISATILDKMNKERKPGRISFFPLDTCKGMARNIPVTEDSAPLLEKISFDSQFQGVVAEVFGRTAVTTTLEAGAKVVKDIQCDAVTLDGDQIGRRGGITGGFLDKRNMKLTAYTKEKALAQELNQERKKLDDLCQEVATVEQSITEVLNELDLLRNQNTSTEKRADDNIREARLREERLQRLKSQREGLLLTHGTLDKNMKDSTALIARLQEEIQEEFTVSWSSQEEETLEKLSAELSTMKVNSSSLQAQVLRLATEVQLAEDTAQHLDRRKTAVDDRIREIGWSKRSTYAIDREHDCVKSEYVKLNERLSQIEKSIEEASKEKQKLVGKLDGLKSTKLSAAMSLQERKDSIDQTQAQRNLLLQRRDDAIQKLRKLGIVPQGIEKYAKLSLGKIMHHLKNVNERLKKFSHVNRKALDQHTMLLETKNDLTSQRDSLSNELKSIHELIEHLDKKKDEAIERTYKQIQFQFEEVLKELVGVEDCHAELQLVKREDENKADDPYCAARIRVSFGLGNAVSELEQLSGGQKSLVALALIFAIQRCDPAPFYLFDEIDAALDAEYRTAVARTIEKQSEECQFIFATFKTELLSVADRILGIFFHNKVSRIQSISMDEGMKLLKQAALEDRKRLREDSEP